MGLGRDLSLKIARAPAALSARYNPHRAGARTGPHASDANVATVPPLPPPPRLPVPAARSEPRARGRRSPGPARPTRVPGGSGDPARQPAPADPPSPDARARVSYCYPAVRTDPRTALDIRFRFCAVCRRKYRTKKTPQPDVCTGGGATWRGGIRSCGPDPWPCGRPVVPHRILVSG